MISHHHRWGYDLGEHRIVHVVTAVVPTVVYGRLIQTFYKPLVPSLTEVPISDRNLSANPLISKLKNEGKLSSVLQPWNTMQYIGVCLFHRT
jgi:hypothetical protein